MMLNLEKQPIQTQIVHQKKKKKLPAILTLMLIYGVNLVLSCLIGQSPHTLNPPINDLWSTA